MRGTFQNFCLVGRMSNGHRKKRSRKKKKKQFLLGGAYVEWSLLLEEANRKKRKEKKYLPGAYVEWPLEEAKCEGQLFGRGLQPGRYV